MNAKRSKEGLEALRPIDSLLRKSEKALAKLTPGTWQGAMLEKNIRALKLASALMNTGGRGLGVVTPEEWAEGIHALSDMARRTLQSGRKFLPGTSQHSLQQNRLQALRLVLKAVGGKSGRGQV